MALKLSRSKNQDKSLVVVSFRVARDRRTLGGSQVARSYSSPWQPSLQGVLLPFSKTEKMSAMTLGGSQASRANSYPWQPRLQGVLLPFSRSEKMSVISEATLTIL